MPSNWWTRRASASDSPSTAPPRTTIRAARSFDPPASSSVASSSTLPEQQPAPVRSRTNSTSDGRTLNVIANAFGFSGTSLGKSKSRERLRSGTTNESGRLGPGSTPPSLVHASSFFAAGAATAPVRRPPKTSLGDTSSRIPRSSLNRQTVVSTESGSSWGATSSAEPHEPTGSSWEPTTPSSGSEPKHSFQSMGMVVGEDPFARSPVWIAGGPEPGSKSRKKEKERERQAYPERTRRLGVSAGSDAGGGEDGSVSPLALSPLAGFPVPPESMLPRRAASALAPGSSLAPRPVGVRSHSANSPGAQYVPLPSGGSGGGYVSSPGPVTPNTPISQPLTPVSPQPSPRTHTSQLPRASSSQPRPHTSTSRRPTPTQQYRVPSLHIPTVSALQMHAHASAAETYSPHSPDDMEFSPSEGSPVSVVYPVHGLGLAVGEMGELGRERMGLDEPRVGTAVEESFGHGHGQYVMRRGHSAHAVLSRAGEPARAPIGGTSSSRNGSAKPVVANGSTKPVANGSTKSHGNGSGKAPLGVGVGRAGMGMSGVVGMGSMTALASGIVTGLGEEGVGVGSGSTAAGESGSNVAGNGSGSGGNGRGPPKRPSRSELRERPSNASLRSGAIVPPARQSSLYPVPRHVSAGGRLGEVDEDGPSVKSDGLGVATTSNLGVSPATSSGTSPASSSIVSPATTPNASTASTPNASSASVQNTPSSRPLTRDTTPTSPSPIKPLPSLAIPRAQSPPPRVSEEESVADFDHYRFAPVIEDADSGSFELGSDLGFEHDDSGQWLAWSEEDGNHLGAGDASTLGRRPPPSPTNLPWMAGNAGRRPTRRDAVYPSGVHIIPTAALRDLASLGREEDSVRAAVVGRTVVEEEEGEQTAETINPVELEAEDSLAPALCSISEKFPTPPASAPPSSPSPVHPLTLLSSTSTGSLTSSSSSLAPEMVPPVTVSSRVEFSRHTRSGSYSDSELDLDTCITQVKFARTRNTSAGKPKASAGSALIQAGTSTAVAWRCGAGNHQKCCGTRSLQEGPNMGRWKCCAERTPSGKSARCCASFVGRPCERPRVSSTSSASVHEAAKALKRQRSFHLSSLPVIGSSSGSGPGSGSSSSPGGAGAFNTPGRKNRFFHRPHTSHGKSTSSALLDDDTRSLLSVKSGGMSKEDPGPMVSVGPDDVFGPRPAALATIASPPTSPLARQEFKAQYILSPAKLHDHLKKEAVNPPAASPVPPAEPGLKSPRLEPSRARSNTTNTNITATSIMTDTSGSQRSAFSAHSSDRPAPMRQLLPPRRVHNTSLPAMPVQPLDHPRRNVRSTSTLSQPSSGPPPLLRSPIVSPGLPPPPRGRVGTQPIVSFISSRSAPTPRGSDMPVNGTGVGVGLRHRSSRESDESASTLRRERSLPLREGPVSFLEIDLEEESGAEDEDEEDQVGALAWARPTLQHSRSFLDLSSRQSGDTMRENEAMFS